MKRMIHKTYYTKVKYVITFYYREKYVTHNKSSISLVHMKSYRCILSNTFPGNLTENKAKNIIT